MAAHDAVEVILAKRDKHELTEGATGYGVRLLVQYLETLA